MENIAIYGAGGFGRETACLINTINKNESKWNIVGFFDDNILLKDSSNTYGKILGGMDTLNNWPEPLCLVMAIGNPRILEFLIKKIDNSGITFPNIIAPDVLIYDPSAVELGKGNLLSHRCVLSCNTKLGDFNLFNTDVFIGHDTSIGNFNIFNPSVRISGEVSIGNTNFFGVSSVVLQQKKVGQNTLIGANSVVIRNTTDNYKYLGNPAIKINI